MKRLGKVGTKGPAGPACRFQVGASLRLARPALAALFWIGLLAASPATTNYVAQGGQTPAPPYTSWATAASNIQDAINQTTAGDTVLVSNGVYEVGGITNFPTGAQTNRVAITKAITVRSFNNDPTNTIIKGAWDPATTNGPAAVRCVYMTNGSTLIGFTLTNGATLTGGVGGGVYNVSIISNCILTGNSAFYGGGSYAGTLFNCDLIGNSANYYGGGSYAGTLSNCTLRGNTTTNTSGSYGGGGSAFATLYNCTIVSNSSARYGGGARGGYLYNCLIISNTAVIAGGGVDGNGTYDAMLTDCTLTANSAPSGGGAQNAKMYNCTLTGNRATSGTGQGGGMNGGFLTNCNLTSNSSAMGGGGASGATLFNCALVGNSTVNYGGGVYNNCTLYNCTIVGNSAGSRSGGADASTLYNCISWGNNIVDDEPSGTFNFSCGVGYTNGGSVSGNTTNDPLFVANGSGFGSGHVAGNYRLTRYSPPLNAGTNFSWLDPPDVRSKDLDGLRRIDRFSGQVDMGCYELMQSGTMFIMK